MIKNEKIDNSRPFDFGLASEDYAKYRDIYPREFYEKIVDKGLCREGQRVLDVGTGTGVLPRNMAVYGGKWTGTDISAQQIEQAKRLSKGLGIDYFVMPAEDLGFADNSFDVICACQCFIYFDHDRTSEEFARLLRAGGRLLVLYMAWLPFEDRTAGESERLILKYNPDWSGAGEKKRPIAIPEVYGKYFNTVSSEEYLLPVHFTRESWHGRIRSSRGIGASLSKEMQAQWEKEHISLLRRIAPPEFDILHYAAVVELEKK